MLYFCALLSPVLLSCTMSHNLGSLCFRFVKITMSRNTEFHEISGTFCKMTEFISRNFCETEFCWNSYCCHGKVILHSVCIYVKLGLGDAPSPSLDGQLFCFCFSVSCFIFRSIVALSKS